MTRAKPSPSRRHSMAQPQHQHNSQPNLPPRPPHRSGPRPLPLHLSLSLASWLSSPIGLMLSMLASTHLRTTSAKSPSPQSLFAKNPFAPNPFAQSLFAQSLFQQSLPQKNLSLQELTLQNPFVQKLCEQSLPEPLLSLGQSLLQQNPSALAPSLSRAVGENLAELLRGIERYRDHPYQRHLSEPLTVWSEGSTRLLDYGRRGHPVVFVPSLVNRAYILDLDEKRSLMRWLSAQGVHPYLVDWGTPDSAERHNGLDAYIDRLTRILAHFKTPPHLVGYCMGGNLALAAALLAQDHVRSLALLATPWDFHATEEAEAEGLRASLLYKSWRPFCQVTGELPVDLLQTLFTLLDPLAPQRKYVNFANMTDDDDVENFVALEDWLNDGVALPLSVADTCLFNWYEHNEPARGQWQVLGQTIDPSQLGLPALVMVPEHDRIVPPATAQALANVLPSRTLLSVPLGHVGMIVSREAPALSWYPLLQWLKR